MAGGVARNAKCPCGSGRKYKNCCLSKASRRVIDDEMQRGYSLEASGEDVAACDVWLRVWELLRERLDPGIRTLMAADDWFDGVQAISNWVGDVSTCLLNVALSDPQRAERGVRCLREILDRFPDEDSMSVVSFRCDLADLLISAGKQDEGERLLEEVIEAFPENPAGYVRLADYLESDRGGPSRPPDVDRAIEVLERAKAVPVRGGDLFDLDRRLRDLRDRKAGRPGAW